MARPVCVIVNPSAGSGRAARRLPEVEAGLRSRGVPFRVARTTSLAHAQELAREAVERGEVAAAMGGDGIVGTVAHALRGTEGILGVIPGGRGNDFARKLGIGATPEASCEVLATAEPRAVDAAEANGATFLGIVSAGIDSDCQVIANSTRLKLGSLVYVYATLRALRAWKGADWEVTVDGDTRRFNGYAVAVCNSGVFGGGMYLSPESSVFDGRLEVVLTERSSKLAYLRGIPRVFKGTHVDDPSFHILSGREVTFAADRPFSAFADGDPIADLPATVRVLPGALRVLAP